MATYECSSISVGVGIFFLFVVVSLACADEPTPEIKKMLIISTQNKQIADVTVAAQELCAKKGKRCELVCSLEQLGADPGMCQ